MRNFYCYPLNDNHVGGNISKQLFSTKYLTIFFTVDNFLIFSTVKFNHRQMKIPGKMVHKKKKNKINNIT
jgi:hypothetical protein